MNILGKLGLAPKSNKDAPNIGENKKKQEEASSLKYNVYVRILIFLCFLVALILSIPQTSFKEPVNYSLGEPWRGKDLTAPFTFPVQKTPEELQKERESIRQSTPRIYYLSKGSKDVVQSKLDSLFEKLPALSKQHQKWQTDQKANVQSAKQDSIKYQLLKNSIPISLTDNAWTTLIKNYETLNSSNSRVDNQQTAINLKDELTKISAKLFNAGIINGSKEDISNQQITIRNTDSRSEHNEALTKIRDLSGANNYIHDQLSNKYRQEIAVVGSQILGNIIQPNLIYNKKDSQTRVDEELADISTSKGAVTEGEGIIRRGDIVTKEKYNKLQSLAHARSNKASSMERMLRYGGDVIAIIAILTVFFFYLYLYRRTIFTNNALLMLVLIALYIICLGSSLVYPYENISPYIIPVAVAPIILTIIFDSRVGLLATITLALITGLISGNNFEYVMATTVACSLGLFSVRDIKNRAQFFFITPGIVFLSYAMVAIGFNMTTLQGWQALGNDLFYMAINAVFIFITYPLILLFERTFNVTTDFTLLEYADTNLPLLKNLMIKAPGTFHHSLQVSNLAEAAAGAIGANGLLCRVGGLYHDIGKMENPNYFTENQSGVNEHDKLKPRMSALVIKAHVSNGVKMGEEEGLPDVIINFIETHHGTTLIKYFWEKAKEQADTDKKEIREEDFRYDGPLPQTKETGILLLADCIEASSRSIKDPNYQKLENLIGKMIDARVEEGQLSRTPLTFQDLYTIKETFLNILVGIYHSRVEYPDDEQDKAEKPTDKQVKQQAQDKMERDENIPADEEASGVSEYYNS